MRLLQKLRSALANPITAIYERVSREVAEKTQVAIETVFETIDRTSPILADLLAGNEVRIVVTLKLEEVHRGAAFTGPKP